MSKIIPSIGEVFTDTERNKAIIKDVDYAKRILRVKIEVNKTHCDGFYEFPTGKLARIVEQGADDVISFTFKEFRELELRSPV